MSLKRGNVVLAWYPFASGKGGKRRPCLVIQNDEDNQKDRTVVAQITGVLHRRGDKSHVLIEAATPEGKVAGLLHDSLISFNNLATIEQTLIDKVIGSLEAATLSQVDECLKAALDLPK